MGVAGRDCYTAVKGGIAAITCSMALEFADLRPRTLPPAARQVKAGFQTTSFVSLPHCGAAFTPRLISLPPLQTSSESGRRSFHSAITPGCAAPSPSPNWRRASRRALRCGQPACSGQWRRRHGSGELPCMQRRFPAASCHLPKQAPDRQGWIRCACRQLVLRLLVRERLGRGAAAAFVAVVGVLAEAVFLAGVALL
jgi:hypothetical protein